VEVRRHRGRVLKALAATKNLEFRQKMIGRQLQTVTLEDRMSGVTSNYLRVQLAAPRTPRDMNEVEIGGLTPNGLAERAALQILA
jgi:tRNA A37 methylthiotransferase MiaB